MKYLKLICICLALTGLRCSTYQIAEFKTHVNRSDGSAHWFTTNSELKGKMSKAEWDKERVGYVSHNAEDYGKMFKIFDKICQRNPCTQEISLEDLPLRCISPGLLISSNSQCLKNGNTILIEHCNKPRTITRNSSITR